MKNVLLHILNCIVTNSKIDLKIIEDITQKEWNNLYTITKHQGITAVVFERIKHLPKEYAPPKDLVLRWTAHALSIEKQTKNIFIRSAQFANIMHEQGLQTLVLKGVALSQYYPNPWHREYGDLDCYLYRINKDRISWTGCYESGNSFAEKAGYKVILGHYKHSHIQFEGLEIENHQFALPIRDGKETKALERELRRLVENNTIPSTINNSHLNCPPSDFNALFFIAHAMNHFLYESINFRYVLDWAFFLKAEQDRIDWEKFWVWCDRMHYTRFVQCMNYICKTYLRLQIHAFTVKDDEYIKNLSDRIIQDILEGDNIYNKGHSTLRLRYELVISLFKSIWKYKQVYQKSALWLLLKRTIGMLTKKPTLEE